MPAEERNEMAYEFLMKDFMNYFMALEKIAVEYSNAKMLKNKKDAIVAMQKAISFFKSGKFTEKDAMEECKNVNKSVTAAIDPLAVVKDNVAYTFGGALEREIEKYFFYLENNPKEEKRFERQTAKREALLAKGKNVDWEVIPKSIIEPEEQIESIVSVITRVMNKFTADVEHSADFDADKRCVEIIDYLKEKASQIVYTLTKRIAKEKAIKLMEEVGIPEARIRFRQYPFEFSGGMRQRIVIAIALSANPDILICDEPTTALDVTIQAQILELINNLKRERNLSVIFITHDLGVVANMADRIAVMYAGKIVEYGTANEVFYNPQHPYTWALLSSMPDLDTNEKLDAIPGTPPNMIYPPVGDAFAERNKYALEIDFEMQPPMYEVTPTHFAATWLLHPNAPKVEIPKIITERIKHMKERGGNNGES
jgi:oligopeptide/dipeptide ABC transporter ATP-binding protein